MSEFAGIEAFVHTAEQLSFRGAARRLGITPAAVSKAVAKLEARMSVQLLERTSRKVALTPEGASYLRHCRAALDALQAGRDSVSQASGVPQGRLVVSIPYILGGSLVALLPRLLSRHPKLEVDLRATDRYVSLLEEGVDVAVRIGELDDSALVARRLRSPRWVTVAAPAYLARHPAGPPRTPADLREHVCLKFASGGSDVPWRFSPSAGGSGEIVKLPTSHRLDQGELLVGAALRGVGVAQVFDFLVDTHLAEGRLVELLAHQSAAGPPVHALCRGGRQRTPRIRVFIDLLVESFGRRAPHYLPLP